MQQGGQNMISMQTGVQYMIPKTNKCIVCDLNTDSFALYYVISKQVCSSLFYQCQLSVNDLNANTCVNIEIMRRKKVGLCYTVYVDRLFICFHVCCDLVSFFASLCKLNLRQ